MLCPRVAMATLPVLKYSPAQFLPWGTSGAVSPGWVLSFREEGDKAGKVREREREDERMREREELREEQVENKTQGEEGEAEKLTEKWTARGRQTDCRLEVPRRSLPVTLEAVSQLFSLRRAA